MSLLKERPWSKIAIMWIVERGCLPLERHEKLYEKYVVIKKKMKKAKSKKPLTALSPSSSNLGKRARRRGQKSVVQAKSQKGPLRKPPTVASSSPIEETTGTAEDAKPRKIPSKSAIEEAVRNTEDAKLRKIPSKSAIEDAARNAEDAKLRKISSKSAIEEIARRVVAEEAKPRKNPSRSGIEETVKSVKEAQSRKSVTRKR